MRADDQYHVEIIQSVPGTLWKPVAGSGIHHLGYWSDDVAADSAELAADGVDVAATDSVPSNASTSARQT